MMMINDDNDDVADNDVPVGVVDEDVLADDKVVGDDVDVN